MGFQSPTGNDYLVLALTALISYNRPLILLVVFVLSFAISYYLSKKKVPLSLLISVSVTLLVGLIFIFYSFSQIRW